MRRCSSQHGTVDEVNTNRIAMHIIIQFPGILRRFEMQKQMFRYFTLSAPPAEGGASKNAWERMKTAASLPVMSSVDGCKLMLSLRCLPPKGQTARLMHRQLHVGHKALTATGDACRPPKWPFPLQPDQEQRRKPWALELPPCIHVVKLAVEVTCWSPGYE